MHGLPVKSGKSDWLRKRNKYSAHAQKIGSGQSSRSLLQVRRIVALGSRMMENETAAAVITLGNQRFIDYIPTVGVHGGAHGTPVIIPECASDR